MAGNHKALDDLMTKTSEWLRGVGPVSDIVVSSRIRLARNLEKLSFATRANDASQAEVLRLVEEGMAQAASLRKAFVVHLDDLD